MSGSASKDKLSQNEIAGLALLVFSGIGGTYLWSLKSAAEKLVVLLTPRIHKITLTGMVVRIGVKIKNPTTTTLTLAKPFVSIEHGTTVIGSSVVTSADSNYSIGQGTKIFEPIDIELRLMELAQTAPSILAEYQRTGRLKLTARVTSKAIGVISIEKVIEVNV